MGNKILIEELTEKDIEKCLEIYNHYITNTCFTLEEQELTYQAFKKRYLKISEKYPFIVIKNSDKEVLGYAYLNYFNSRSAYRHTADLSIYISKEHTHEHLGNLLLKKIEEEALTKKITTIISIVVTENMASSKFHIKNGFILEGTLHDVAYKFNRNISVSYYRKRLNNENL